ncbi:MAG: hypothetical protein K9K38_21710 [Rhodoferax sp.]|nr:hypothetical protein [Rhodoferax sp.]
MSFDRTLLPDPASYFEGQGLSLKGPARAKWKTTTCNFHGGSDSMRVNTQNGAWVCMSCGEKGGDVLAYQLKVTGAEFQDAAKAIGAWIEDGRAPPPDAKPSPLSARQALSVLGFESALTAVAAANVGNGYALTQIDLDRLLLAANRIRRIAEVFQ